ncbi:hypothetical protein [Xanthomonas phage vB_XooS_NR08]|nr:hypothetical protein [Xanthomonas phage vB_XooS_NR08]
MIAACRNFDRSSGGYTRKAVIHCQNLSSLCDNHSTFVARRNRNFTADKPSAWK